VTQSLYREDAKGSALGWVQGQRPWLSLLLALTAIRLVVAGTTPLAPDEAYYWVWSRALADGYLDHPPMVALWIRAGTALGGDGAFGVRLLAPLAAALGTLLLVQAANDLLPGRRTGPMAAALLNATLLLGVGAVTMTPDTPLLFFWTATLWALARLHATGRGAWWLVAGLAAGLALDSKYTAFLLLPSVLLWLVWVPTLRVWLRRPHPWGGAALALLLFVPVVEWNATRAWAGFVKQGGRAADWAPARALQFLGELLGGQIGLATPLLAALFGAGIVAAARGAGRRDPGWSLLAALTLLPAVVLLQHAFGDRVQSNWPAILYPAAAIAAGGFLTRWHRPAIGLGLALTALVYVQATLAPFPLPARLDPTLQRMGGWPYLATEIALAAQQTGASFVAVENYGDAAELARALPPGLPVLGIDARWAVFDLPDAQKAIAGRPGLLLRAARYAGPPEAADWFAVGAPLMVARARGGMVAEQYRLYPVVGRAGPVPVVALPRRR
jgi:4-amino-4-deoxy-L-arabinose transferase-like glycosyltransferase